MAAAHLSLIKHVFKRNLSKGSLKWYSNKNFFQNTFGILLHEYLWKLGFIYQLHSHL